MIAIGVSRYAHTSTTAKHEHNDRQETTDHRGRTLGVGGNDGGKEAVDDHASRSRQAENRRHVGPDQRLEIGPEFSNAGIHLRLFPVPLRRRRGNQVPCSRGSRGEEKEGEGISCDLLTIARAQALVNKAMTITATQLSQRGTAAIIATHDNVPVTTKTKAA